MEPSDPTERIHLSMGGAFDVASPTTDCDAAQGFPVVVFCGSGSPFPPVGPSMLVTVNNTMCSKRPNLFGGTLLHGTTGYRPAGPDSGLSSKPVCFAKKPFGKSDSCPAGTLCQDQTVGEPPPSASPPGRGSNQPRVWVWRVGASPSPLCAGSHRHVFDRQRGAPPWHLVLRRER